MFIANFDKQKQAMFLNLAYTMIYADGKLDEKEQMLFNSYQIEVNVDMSDVHKVDFEEGLAIFDECSIEEKQRIFFELYAIALIDDVYADEEKVLVDIVKNRFNISDDKMNQMKNALLSFINAYNNLQSVVTK